MSRASTARAAVDLTFEELYRGHRADVYRAALRELGNAHDAEDVTQAAFVDAYRAVLRGTRPQSPRAWLLAISENVRRRRFRTAQRRPREEALDDADFPLAAELPLEQSRALAEALGALPPGQRRVFVLREIVGLSYDEIAAEVDATVAAIQMLLFRARRSLREELEPPTVASRRPIFLPPLPGWLAGMLSRVDAGILTPRAAGALGAAVLTVVGASVAVPDSRADRPDAPTPRTAAARLATAAPGPAAHPPARSTAGVSRAAMKPAPSRRPPTRFKRARPATTQLPALVPARASDPEPAPVVVPTEEGPKAVPAAELPRVAVTLVDEVVRPVQLPLPTVSLPVPPLVPVAAPPPVAVTPPVSVPLPVPAPLPALPPVPAPLEAATGAAGAAGAGAPPVPVSAGPLPTLPPAP